MPWEKKLLTGMLISTVGLLTLPAPGKQEERKQNVVSLSLLRHLSPAAVTHQAARPQQACLQPESLQPGASVVDGACKQLDNK
jgi:predicted amino acid dehydrogenase